MTQKVKSRTCIPEAHGLFLVTTYVNVVLVSVSKNKIWEKKKFFLGYVPCGPGVSQWIKQWTFKLEVQSLISGNTCTKEMSGSLSPLINK